MIETDKELLFVGGDLSGIQKFIYNISSKKAMVSLKGRSAYLSDYTRNLCNGLIELDPIKGNTTKEIIYCSGGKFYLIVEDTPEIRIAIEAYHSSNEKSIWEEHRGQLGLAIAYVPFRLVEKGGIVIDGVHYDKIGELWHRISILFTHLKNRRYYSLITGEFESFFEVIPVEGDNKVCAITGIEDNNCIRLDKDNDGDEIWVLPSVLKQIEIGRALRAKDGFKTLEEYAEESYIGVLRMDVDGLGARFVKGFASFEEYSAFSNKLSSFFDLKLRDIQKKYQDSLNIVYAGGDDLFAVGRWDKIVDFAEEVHDSFNNHMAGEQTTISGGMAIVGDKFPIAKSAEISGQAEEAAKMYRNGQKNAFSFLGECVSWESEFDMVKQLKNQFVHQIVDNNLPRGVLHQLIRYANLAMNGDDLSYKWHEVYYLSRVLDRLGQGNLGSKDFVSKLRKESLSRTIDQYRILALAARWAELSLRINKNNY